MRLGKLPSDAIRLAQAQGHRFGAVLPPATLDRSVVDFVPGLYGNDTYPCCTAVALANCARGVAHLNGYDLIVEESKPLAFYGQCVGNPPDLALTNGAVALDVLGRQARAGFDIGPQTLVAQWGTIDTKSRTAIARAMAVMGPLYLGVMLHDREMQTSGVWDVQPGRDDGPVIGGHMVPGWSFDGLADNSIVQIMSWGRFQPVTWAWLMARLDEAHGVAWRQLARADGTFYRGLSADGLIAEVDTS